MRKLDDGRSSAVPVRLSLADRAQLVGELARVNQTVETEQWIGLTRKVTTSQVVRFALRSFWSDWLACSSDIRAYYAARVAPSASDWVVDRLLYALVANESDGFCSRNCRQSSKFSADPSVRPMVFCGWTRSSGNCGSVMWGVLPIAFGLCTDLYSELRLKYPRSEWLREKPAEMFGRLVGMWPLQHARFGTFL